MSCDICKYLDTYEGECTLEIADEDECDEVNVFNMNLSEEE